jgi:energy-coupling factor transport system permease protein
VYLLSSLVGALLFILSTKEITFTFKSAIGYVFLLVLIAVTNPLFSHNGATPLFFINDNRITLEALLYGFNLGIMIIDVLLLFKAFNYVFTGDKLMYFFGKASPKLALVVSMTLNFIPRVINSFKEIHSLQQNFRDKQGKLKGYIASFSAVITQSLENSIIISDSMKARAYGLKHRTFYNSFKFTLYDGLYLLLMVLLFGLSVFGFLFKATDFAFYPYITLSDLSSISVISYLSFLLLSLLPVIYQLKEGIKWKYSVSKI